MSARALALCGMLAGAFAAHAANIDANAGAALRAAVAIEQARPPAHTLPREAFLDSRALQVVRLAPDGRHVAWLRDEGESRSLWLLPTAGGAARRLLPRTDADRMYWSQDGRWLFLVSSRSLASLPLEGGGGMRVPVNGIERRGVMQVDASQPAAVILREDTYDREFKELLGL